MKTSQHLPDPAAEEQAALWAARLDGDTLDRTQRAELDAWLAENAAHRTLLSRYCQFSADLEEQIPALVKSGAVTMPKVAEQPARRGWIRSFPRLGGITLAAAAAIVIAFVVFRGTPAVENLSTSPAERSSHTLADGTRVELNAHTSLRFENSASERRVRLAGGEALFIVTKDAQRPFIVETPSGSVRVTGTTFNVRNDDGTSVALEVIVLEGSVQVRPNIASATNDAGPFSLTASADNRFSLTTDGEVATQTLSAGELEDVVAWRDGQIVFAGVPLREVAARLARHHGKRITVAPTVADIPVGGRLGLDDFESFLSGIETLLPGVQARTDKLSGAVSIGPRSGS